VLRELVDATGEQSHLNLGRTGVGVVQSIALNDLLLLLLQ